MHCPCAIDLVLEASVQPKPDSGGGSSGSAKKYRGYQADGQVAGRMVSALDGQSQLRDLVDAVDRSEGAWQTCSWCSYGESGQVGPSLLVEAVKDYLVIGATGLW
jgi:hypothetical protein